jgi:hypothetical protein
MSPERSSSPLVMDSVDAADPVLAAALGFVLQLLAEEEARLARQPAGYRTDWITDKIRTLKVAEDCLARGVVEVPPERRLAVQTNFDATEDEHGGGSCNFLRLAMEAGVLTLGGGHRVSDGQSASDVTGAFEITWKSGAEAMGAEHLDKWLKTLSRPMEESGPIVYLARP